MLDARTNKERKEDSQIESKTTSTNPQTIGEIVREFDNKYGKLLDEIDNRFNDGQTETFKQALKRFIIHALHAYEEAVIENLDTRIVSLTTESGVQISGITVVPLSQIAQKRKAFWGE